MKHTYLIIIMILCSINVFSQNNRDSIKHNKLVPDYVVTQFAGNIGYLSGGIGYNLLNDRIKAELIYGYVPERYSVDKIRTITLKAIFPVFEKQIYGITISPYLGLTSSYEMGNNSKLILPDYYPKGYYATNAFHFTFIGGVNFHTKLPHAHHIHSMDLYCETITVDNTFWYFISSKEIKANMVFSIDLGARFYF